MKIGPTIVLLCAAAALIGCGKENSKAMPRASAPDVADDGLDTLQDRVVKRIEARQAVLDGIRRDKDGELFRIATDRVKAAMEAAIGTNVAAKGTITPVAVEDFGEYKWQVTGTYSGPDREGKEFASDWMIELQWDFDELETVKLDLGKPKFDE